jgi:hypothetical protein
VSGGQNGVSSAPRLLWRSAILGLQRDYFILHFTERHTLTIFTNVHNNQTKFDITNHIQQNQIFIYSFTLFAEKGLIEWQQNLRLQDSFWQ